MPKLNFALVNRHATIISTADKNTNQFVNRSTVELELELHAPRNELTGKHDPYFLVSKLVQLLSRLSTSCTQPTTLSYQANSTVKPPIK